MQRFIAKLGFMNTAALIMLAFNGIALFLGLFFGVPGGFSTLIFWSATFFTGGYCTYVVTSWKKTPAKVESGV